MILNKRYAIPVLCCVLALLLVSTAFSQETTAGIQGTVKDSSGAVVTGATVAVTGSGLIGKKTATTDTGGYFRFANLSPGVYNLLVSAPNFRTFKSENIELATGRLPTIDVTLQVGAASETVEVSGAAPLVDVTQSKVQTNVTSAEINSLPHGRSYQSVIPFAPGARQEPLQSSRNDPGRLNGFQIDGASDAENVYMTEGLNTTSIYGGGVGANVPFEFVQEVQVKSSSFEAEYGGATGGVINVIQKRGSNAWHGSLFTYYRGDPVTANDQCVNREIARNNDPLVGQFVTCGLRAKPGTSLNAGSAAASWSDRQDVTPEIYQGKQDKWYTIEPGFEVGGPLIKDRLWLFSSYVPSLSSVTRTVNFTGANPGLRSFTQTFNQHNFMNRLDYRLANSVRLFGSWQSGYSRLKGVQYTLTPDSVIGQVNTQAGTDPNTLRSDTGNTNPLTILNFGGDWTIGSKLVVTGRIGSFYTDTQDRGKTSGTRYIWQVDSTCSPTNPFGCTLPAANQHTAGFANIPSNQQQAFDIFKRRQYGVDAAYFVGHFMGTHNFKVGYSLMSQAEDVANTFQTSQVLIWYTNTDAYTAASGPTSTVCATVIAANGACRGPYGYYMLRDGVLTNGKVSAKNHSLYFQDGWTIKSLTINAGVRFDKEFLPPYNPLTSSGIAFGFDQKVAPRIGAAYDVFHNGKLKVYGSYGKFFDIMKYSLPRGSFGGDRWHDCVYALTTTDFNSIVPTNIGGKFCPDGKGTAAGSLPGTFIENQDWRSSASGLASDPVVDPNMHPMSTHEFVFGANWEVKHNLAFETRYARKRVDWTIEDMSLDDGQYYIGNPGTTYSQLLHRALPNAGFPVAVCPTCPNLPKAIRDYDGLEFRLIRRASDKWFGQIAYAYSRLHGNYAGLSDTYFTDGNGGRHEPNNGRAFDLPQMLFDGQGHTISGPLPTDRPHVVSGIGYYRLKWWGMETLLGATQEFASGTPETTCLGTVDSQSSCMFIAGQGNWINFHQDPTTRDIVQDSISKGKRTPWLVQTDLSFSHELKVSKTNEALRLSFTANATNVFNQHAVMVVNNQPIAGSQYVTPSLPGSPGWDYLKLMNSFNYLSLMNDKTVTAGVYGGPNTNGAPNTYASRYGMPVVYQSARSMRFQVKFAF